MIFFIVTRLCARWHSKRLQKIAFFMMLHNKFITGIFYLFIESLKISIFCRLFFSTFRISKIIIIVDAKKNYRTFSTFISIKISLKYQSMPSLLWLLIMGFKFFLSIHSTIQFQHNNKNFLEMKIMIRRRRLRQID